MSKFLELTENPQRLYAIGDIHGCAEELEVLLGHLIQREGLSEQDQVIFIGDYVDRGPSSKQVIDTLIEFQRRYPATIFLRGNHEDMFLDFLGYGGSLGKAYVFNGGAETLQSYGWDVLKPAQEVSDEMPKTHIAFLLNLESYVISDEYVFAHAGLNPMRELRAQIDHDLFWIRDEFVANIHHFGKTVVFGHTPHQDILFHWPYKIGIDTGLVYGNVLTCIELLDRNVFQVESGGRKVKVRSYLKPA